MDLENFPTSEAAKRMIEYVTKGFYDKSYVGKWLYQVMGQEMDDVKKIYDELPYQAFPETATWGLFYHEIKYGIPIRNDLDYADRRKIIMTKRDTRSPMNPWQMEQVIKALTGYDADVNDNLEITNTFCISVYCHSGTLDLQKVVNKINRIKQSHVKLVKVEGVISPKYEICFGMANFLTKEMTISFD